jgi:hypothetical protein
MNESRTQEKTLLLLPQNAVPFEAKRCSFWGGMAVATDVGENPPQMEIQKKKKKNDVFKKE